MYNIWYRSNCGHVTGCFLLFVTMDITCFDFKHEYIIAV